MRTKEIQVFVYECNEVSELPEEDKKLMEAAREAASKAYAPYSRFNVGAAFLLDNNEIIWATTRRMQLLLLVYVPNGWHYFMQEQHFPDMPVKAIAVTAFNENGKLDEPVKPCGACRQAILETEVRFKKSIRIILDGKNKIQVFEGVENLLPFAFKPESLD